MRLLLTCFLVVFYLTTQGQTVSVIEAPEVTQLVQKHIRINRLTETIEGYRIQIFSTTDRTKVETARTTFKNLYPHIPIDFVHASPWYRLRAGAYATKLEASHALEELKANYQGAYLAKDRFRPEELLSY